MGSLGSRFGRNVPLEHTYPDDPKRLLDPNPRLISRRLLTRESFQPATTLNLLAGAWIQFEVHDWLSHDPELPDPWEIPLEKDDPWPEHPMKILRTKPDPSPDAERAADVCHGRHPLVGRLAGLRRQAGLRRRPAVAREGAAPHRRPGPAAGRPPEVRRPVGRRRQLLGRPRHPPLALHARAQRHLRAARGGVPGAVRPGALRQGAARECRAHGQGPHGGLDAGDHRPPDHRAGASHELVRAARRASPRPGRAASPTTRCSTASPARRRTTTACPTR